MIITVNNRNMNFLENEDGSLSLPILFKMTKNGTKQFWTISVSDKYIYRQSFIDGGKIRDFEAIEAIGKNSGKKNQTNANEQALFEAYSYWLKKQDQGYILEGTGNSTNILPMLANRYTDKGAKYLSEPFGVSPKLDGIRALGIYDQDRVCLKSRLGKDFVFLNTIKQHLETLFRQFPNVVFDGELYSHSIPFNLIAGIVKSTKNISDMDDKMEYWIFDIITETDTTYKKRMDILKSIEKYYNTIYNNKNLKFVYYDIATHTEVDYHHTRYVSQGFEGIMCREMTSFYELGKRSNYLLKYKNFDDAEFEIIGYKKAKGTEEGAIVFMCKTDKQDVFEVRPRGTIQDRREMYKNGEKYIGKLLTVRFQGIGTHNCPRFPVGIIIRDYE